MLGEVCGVNGEEIDNASTRWAQELGVTAGRTVCVAGDIDYCMSRRVCWISEQSRGQRYCPTVGILDETISAETMAQATDDILVV